MTTETNFCILENKNMFLDLAYPLIVQSAA